MLAVITSGKGIFLSYSSIKSSHVFSPLPYNISISRFLSFVKNNFISYNLPPIVNSSASSRGLDGFSYHYSLYPSKVELVVETLQTLELSRTHHVEVVCLRPIEAEASFILRRGREKFRGEKDV